MPLLHGHGRENNKSEQLILLPGSSIRMERDRSSESTVTATAPFYCSSSSSIIPGNSIAMESESMVNATAPISFSSSSSSSSPLNKKRKNSSNNNKSLEGSKIVATEEEAMNRKRNGDTSGEDIHSRRRLYDPRERREVDEEIDSLCIPGLEEISTSNKEKSTKHNNNKSDTKNNFLGISPSWRRGGRERLEKLFRERLNNSDVAATATTTTSPSSSIIQSHKSLVNDDDVGFIRRTIMSRNYSSNDACEGMLVLCRCDAFDEDDKDVSPMALR